MKYSFAKRLNSESGVIIPLAAVVALSVFVVLSILGIDSALVHYKSAQLRKEATTICDAIIEKAPVQRAASLAFMRQVNNLDTTLAPQGVRLERARLIMPTMPNIFVLPSGYRTTSMDNDYSASPPHLTGAQSMCLNTLLGAEGPCNNGTFCSSPDRDFGSFLRCVIQGDVYYGNSRNVGPGVNSDFYPAGMMHNLSHAGNMAICELEASIASSLIPGVRRAIKGVAGFRSPAVGYFDSRTTDNWGFPRGVPYPGLSVAVAPHMTTWRDASPLDARFQFRNSPAILNQTRYDPLAPSWNFNPNFADCSLSASSSPSACNATPVGLFGGTFAGIGAPQNFNSVPGPTGSNLQEARLACGNLATLARNVFTTTILELAARHGMFRNFTELLLVGTQHRNVSAQNQISPNSNFPVQITALGEDLTERAYTVPYVSYFSGNSSSSIPGFIFDDIDGSSNGWVDPFTSGSPDIQTNHAWLSSQLAFCYHLYRDTQAFTRFPVSPFDSANLDFEDSAAFSPLDTPERLRPSAYASSDPWVQACPWENLASPLTCTPPPGTSSRKLRAPEITSMLGSIQNCPYPMLGAYGANCDKSTAKTFSDNVASASTATLDLRPDLVGLVKYLTRAPLGTSVFPALASPGIFPYSGLNPTFNQPFGATNANPRRYVEAEQMDSDGRSSTSLLLVTHQRINGSLGACNCSAPTSGDEVCNLRCLVEQGMRTRSVDGRRVRRPITIAYFPTTAADASDAAITNLAAAFQATVSASKPEDASVLVFSPRALANSDTTFEGDLVAACSGAAPSYDSACSFQYYWTYILSEPNSSLLSIVNQASSVFNSRLTQTGVLY